MQTKKPNQNRILTVSALLFLFFTRLMAHYLEQRADLNLLLFSAECVLFLIIYGICVFNAPKLIAYLSLATGCAILSALCFFLKDSAKTDFLLPAMYFPVFLVFIDQYGIHAENKDSASTGKIKKSIMTIYPWIEIGLILYAAIEERIHFSMEAICCMFLSGLLCAVYIWIIHMQKKHYSHREEQNHSTQVLSYRTAFLFAAFSIPATCLFSVLTGNTIAAYNLLILWTVNLLLLYTNRHPQVCAFSTRLKQFFSIF